ncbi:MAG: hypothetical protein M1814_004478 [Vezdaea aestivalis]|nr:MAG: hypothetical protein M1814_004478 [Vezdaea aestivalis]
MAPKKQQRTKRLPEEAVITTPANRWPPPYHFDGGLRRVEPYHFTYVTHCKQRWRGRELLDIFASEFRDRPYEYYKKAIENGDISVNGIPVTNTATVIDNGDTISHTMHRHEPPVTAQEIGIVYEDEELIVINKPPGMPVHAAGRYNFNSVLEIMRAQRWQGWLSFPCNRLDRLTGGIMFIAKNGKSAEMISNQIRGRAVKKEYVARVIGEFPEGDVICEEPMLAISPKLGLNRVRANGKDAKTVFKRLAYYPPRGDSSVISSEENLGVENAAAEKAGGYSIVRCLPLTGRTHQLRVHLQFLGHPIANDPIYANQRVFGPLLGFQDDTDTADEDIISRLSRMGKDQVAEAVAYHDEMVDDYNKRKAEKMTGEICDVCATPLYSDPGMHELGIYLHARKYAHEDGSWSYETNLPDWALPPSGTDGPTETTQDTDPLLAVKEKEA